MHQKTHFETQKQKKYLRRNPSLSFPIPHPHNTVGVLRLRRLFVRLRRSTTPPRLTHTLDPPLHEGWSSSTMWWDIKMPKRTDAMQRNRCIIQPRACAINSQWLMTVWRTEVFAFLSWLGHNGHLVGASTKLLHVKQRVCPSVVSSPVKHTMIYFMV